MKFWHLIIIIISQLSCSNDVIELVL